MIETVRIQITMEVDVEGDEIIDNETGEYVPFADPNHEMGISDAGYRWLIDKLPGSDIEVVRL